MTLILALLCDEGVILASDSQATDAAPGTEPRRSEVTKLWSLGPQVVWGAAGDVGVRQVVHDALKSMNENDFRDPLERFRLRIPTRVTPAMRQVREFHVPVEGTSAPEADFLFAGHTGGQPWILEIHRNGIVQDHNDQRWYAIGSGTNFAAMALGVLLHYGVRIRTLQQCQVVVYRIMETVVSNSAYGVGPPIQIWEITSQGARVFPPEEVQALNTTVNTWRALEAETLDKLFEADDTTVVDS